MDSRTKGNPKARRGCFANINKSTVYLSRDLFLKFNYEYLKIGWSNKSQILILQSIEKKDYGFTKKIQHGAYDTALLIVDTLFYQWLDSKKLIGQKVFFEYVEKFDFFIPNDTVNVSHINIEDIEWFNSKVEKNSSRHGISINKSSIYFNEDLFNSFQDKLYISFCWDNDNKILLLKCFDEKQIDSYKIVKHSTKGGLMNMNGSICNMLKEAGIIGKNFYFSYNSENDVYESINNK